MELGISWKRVSHRRHYVHLALVLTLLQLVSWSTPFPVFGSSGPLYSPEDFVYSLNGSNIQQKIFDSDRVWLLEFYSSWCGHCVSFAPKWIQFAKDLKEWRSLVVIAAIDCANDANVPACREFEIMGYPTLKIFPNHAPAKVKDEGGKYVLNIGEVFKRPQSMTTLKNNLMEALVPMFPKVLSESGSLAASKFSIPSELWKDPEFTDGPPFLLLVYESPKSFVGLEVALRLSRYNDSVRVLRFSEKNPMYNHLALDSWPAAGYFAKDGASGSLILEKNQDIVDLITAGTIELAQITKIDEKPELVAPVQEEVGETNGEVSGDLQLKPFEDKVSMEDLLHTVRNSLRNEVGLLQKLEGTKISALKSYLGVLTQYFPSDRREVQMFLVKLSDWIRPQREIESVNYLEKLNELELEFNPWDIDMSVWYDCRATVPGRRGYSCGLWRLFHTLTVIGFEKHEDSPLLAAIHGYVKEFFGCRECSKHFVEMIERDDALQLRTIQEQMIWIWKSHNEVNLRLKGTPSEDPAFPKGYYPTITNCGTCYDTTATSSFNENKVKEYLLRIYSRPERYHDKNSGDPRKSLNSTASKLRSGAWLGGYFSLTDVGIFMILYFSIAVLLIFAYIHFKVARRRRFDPIFCLHRFCSRLSNRNRSIP